MKNTTESPAVSKSRRGSREHSISWRFGDKYKSSRYIHIIILPFEAFRDGASPPVRGSRDVAIRSSATFQIYVWILDKNPKKNTKKEQQVSTLFCSDLGQDESCCTTVQTDSRGRKKSCCDLLRSMR